MASASPDPGGGGRLPDEDQREPKGHGDAASPELFSTPRMPQFSFWLPLLIGVPAVAITFLVQTDSGGVQRWLVMASLWAWILVRLWVQSPILLRWIRIGLLRSRAAPVLRLLHARWDAAEILASVPAT